MCRVKNHYTYIDDKLLRYLADSLAWVNFSVDNKDVVYQGLDFEGVNTLYPNQITSFKKLILAWIVPVSYTHLTLPTICSV